MGEAVREDFSEEVAIVLRWQRRIGSVLSVSLHCFKPYTIHPMEGLTGSLVLGEIYLLR